MLRAVLKRRSRMTAIEKKSETNEEYFNRKPWLLKGDGTLREEGEGEWRIALHRLAELLIIPGRFHGLLLKFSMIMKK
jgi:hypothetical protein